MREWLGRHYRNATVGLLGDGAPRWLGPVVEIVHAGVVLVRETFRDRLHVRAAMLSYWTSVAIVPILLLAFALTAPLGLAEDSREAVLDLLYDTVLAESVGEVAVAIDSLLQSINLRTFGIVGVLGIMLIGSNLFFNIELAYNDIFNVRVRRSRLLRFTLFYAAITLAPLVIAAGFLMSARLPAAAGVFTRVAPVLLTASVLIAGIRLLPCVPVRWRAAVAGGLVSAILFEGAKVGFSAYTDLLGTKDNLTRIYGGVAFLPVFLLWLYVLWLIILFGVEVAYLTQHYHQLIDEQRRRAADPYARQRSPDGFFALQVMLIASDAYIRGATVTVDQVANVTGAAPLHVQMAVDVLEDAGMLVELEEKRYIPGRPPNKISGAEVVALWREHATPVVHGTPSGVAAIGQGIGAATEALSETLEELLRLAPPGRTGGADGDTPADPTAAPSADTPRVAEA